MAKHVQQQVIEALAAALGVGSGIGAASVFVDRVDPLPVSRLPAFIVEESERGETVELETLEGTEQRTLEVRVSCLVAGGDDYGQRARALGLQAERALSGTASGAEPLYELCAGGVQLMASAIALSGEGRDAVAVRTQLWHCIYSINPDRPDVALSF